MSEPNEAILPLNITAATLLIQLLLMGTFAITVAMLRRGENRRGGLTENALPRTSQLSTIILGVALFSFAILLVSEEFYAVWRPVFSGVELSTIEARTSLSVVIVIDIVLVGVLMFMTGGSKDSPFTPVLLVLPSLAIFLRETPWRFILYAVGCGIVFIVLLVLSLPLFLAYRRSPMPPVSVG